MNKKYIFLFMYFLSNVMRMTTHYVVWAWS